MVEPAAGAWNSDALEASLGEAFCRLGELADAAVADGRARRLTLSDHGGDRQDVALIVAPDGAGDIVMAKLADDAPDRAAYPSRAESRRNALLLAAVEASPVNVTIADPHRPDMPLVYVNPAFTKTTGYPQEEVLGRNCRFLQGPDTDPRAVAEISRLVDTLSSGRVTILNYRKDGTPFWNVLDLTPVFDDSRELIAYLGIQTDITDRIAREAAERERQKLVALGQLAGGLAHEINNLLQPTLTLAQLLQDRCGRDDPETFDDLETIADSARQARDVVRSVLLYARKDAPTPDSVPLGQALGKSLKFTRDLLPPTVTIASHGVDGFTGIARINRVELTQILTNLLVNASQAMRGKGTIHVALSQTYLAEAGAADLDLAPGAYAVLAVRDTGCGMDGDTLSRIFEPFFTTKPVGEGTGLGLAIVYGTVRDWGGTVKVDSIPGEGAAFELYIPLIEQPHGAGAQDG